MRRNYQQCFFPSIIRTDESRSCFLKIMPMSRMLISSNANINEIVITNMPKLCIECGEIKSKSLFIKGRVSCKKCDNSSVTNPTMDGSIIEIPEIESVKTSRIDEMVANLSTLQDVPKKLDMLLLEMNGLRSKLERFDKLQDTLDDALLKLEALEKKVASNNILVIRPTNG